MIRYFIIFITTFLSYHFSFSQSAKTLFEEQRFEELAALGADPEKLTPEDLYLVGFAYFRLENDASAIEFYDKALEKGFDSAYVHFYKALSYRFLKEYKKALSNLEIAMKKAPNNSEYMNEKGLIYMDMEKFTEARSAFVEASKMTPAFAQCHYWMAYSLHRQEAYSDALKDYYTALEKIPQENPYYLRSLQQIGILEYTVTKNYTASIDAYKKAIAVDSGNYELLYKLIKSYNANRMTKKADEVFQIVKAAFERGELPEEDMEIKTIAIAEFEWEGKRAVIRKSLVDPKNMLDVSYKVFVLNEAGDKIERRFLVEKTLSLGKGNPNHLLCEKNPDKGSHITYPYGWEEDNISAEDIEKAVIMVLEGKLKAGASSSFGK